MPGQVLFPYLTWVKVTVSATLIGFEGGWLHTKCRWPRHARSQAPRQRVKTKTWATPGMRDFYKLASNPQHFITFASLPFSWPSPDCVYPFSHNFTPAISVQNSNFHQFLTKSTVIQAFHEFVSLHRYSATHGWDHVLNHGALHHPSPFLCLLICSFLSQMRNKQILFRL